MIRVMIYSRSAAVRTCTGYAGTTPVPMSNTELCTTIGDATEGGPIPIVLDDAQFDYLCEFKGRLPTGVDLAEC